LNFIFYSNKEIGKNILTGKKSSKNHFHEYDDSRFARSSMIQSRVPPPSYNSSIYDNNQQNQLNSFDLSKQELNETMMEIFRPFDKDGDGEIIIYNSKII
jgi:hypothetical protein